MGSNGVSQAERGGEVDRDGALRVFVAEGLGSGVEVRMFMRANLDLGLDCAGDGGDLGRLVGIEPTTSCATDRRSAPEL